MSLSQCIYGSKQCAWWKFCLTRRWSNGLQTGPASILLFSYWYYGVLSKKVFFWTMDFFFGHNTIECQWKDSRTLIRAMVWLIAQEHPTSMIEVFAHHGMETKTIKTCYFFKICFKVPANCWWRLVCRCQWTWGDRKASFKTFSSSMSSPDSQFQINLQAICWWG